MPRKPRLDVMAQAPLCNTDMLAQHSLVLVTARPPSGRPALVFLATMRQRPHGVRLPIGADSEAVAALCVGPDSYTTLDGLGPRGVTGRCESARVSLNAFGSHRRR